MRLGLGLGLCDRWRFGAGSPPPADVTAPTLSSPTAAKNGQTAMTGSVSTNEANGTLYRYISTSATPPSAANLKAGTGAVASGSQAVSSTGVQNVTASGLTAGTIYYTYFLHRDAAGNDSAIAAAAAFTTDAAGGSLDPALPTPTLALTSSNTAYPPTISVAVPYYSLEVGDVIRIQAAVASDLTDPDFTSMVVNGTRTITSNGAADLAAINALLAGLASGNHFIRATINDGPASNLLLHGTATAPALTGGSGTFSTPSSIRMTQNLTLNMPGRVMIRGEDSELMEVVPIRPDGSVAPPSEIHLHQSQVAWRIRWKNDEIRPYTAGDFDGDYIFEPLIDIYGANGAVTYGVQIAATLTESDAAPDAATFTDQQNAILGQPYSSGNWTIAGIDSEAFIGTFTRVGNGTYTKNGVSGLTAANPTYQLGDVFSIEGTTASGGTPQGGSFNFGGTIAAWAARPDATPDSVSFTNVTNAPLSSTGSSNTVTFSGIGAGYMLDASVVLPDGWTYTKNGNSGLTATNFTISVGDTFSFQYVAPATNATAAIGELTVGGTTYTFSATTVLGNIPYSNEAIFFLDYKDVSTLKQSVVGTTDATAVNDPVGYWADKSATGAHMVAASDSAGVRPTLAADGVVFTTSQRLQHIFANAAASLNLWTHAQATGATVIILGKFTAAATAQGSLFAEGSTGSSTPTMAFGRSGSGNAMNLFLRNDANNILVPSAAQITGNSQISFDGNLACLIYELDALSATASAGRAKGRDDNTQGAGFAFTRSGTLTTDRIALNSFARSTAAVQNGGTYQLVMVIPRLLTTAEKNEIVAYAAAYQGRTI